MRGGNPHSCLELDIPPPICPRGLVTRPSLAWGIIDFCFRLRSQSLRTPLEGSRSSEPLGKWITLSF